MHGWGKMTNGSAAMEGVIPNRRRELWLRQLMRKWGDLRNTGSSGFNRDMEMDVELPPEECENMGGGSQDDELEAILDLKMTELEQPVKDFKSVATGLRPSRNTSLVRGQSETLRQQFIDHHQYRRSCTNLSRIAVHTWNVAGKPPPDDLDLEGWISISHPADIYVFGFQEVVPLNAHNVLSVEDKGPAALWEAKIRETLNKDIGPHKTTLEKSLSVPHSPRNVVDVLVTDVPEVSDVERLLTELSCASFHESSLSAASEEVIVRGKSTEFGPPSAQNDARSLLERNLLAPIFPWNDVSLEENPRQLYSRVASKQMVGLFITVWIRSHLWRHVHNVQVSTVGCGLMNHLGNKGSISVSMFLHYTSFCFVCSHLTSGHKEGDALRRNADVAEILRRTKFPRLAKLLGLGLPETILAHDRVIWLGDLNYRLALPDKETWTLVKRGDWTSLLSMDQLKLEQGEGRVFPDWQEGPIYFPPTYKYMNGSDQYSTGESTSSNTFGAGSSSSSSSKRRSPAWCDRVLWYGQGLQQLDYTREESKLSDHRSVSATFTAEVEVVSSKKLKKACVHPVSHEFDVRSNVLPMVKPVIDIRKIHSNEVWSTLFKKLNPRRHRHPELDMNSSTRPALRGLLQQQAWFDANDEDGFKIGLVLHADD